MLRIQCTADDLLRVTIAGQPLPLAEAAIAMAMIQRRDAHPVFAPWRKRVLRGLPSQAHPLLQLVSPRGAGPDFLEPPSVDFDEGIDRIMSTPLATVRAELRWMSAIDRPVTPWVRLLAERDRDAWRELEQALRSGYRAVLAERWPQLRAAFNAETAWRTRILARDGLYAALSGLAPSIRWRDTTTLEVDSPNDATIMLTGRGIILYPTLLWTGHLLAGQHPDGRLLLFYPAATPLPLLDAPAPAEPITALLGATRARALRVLIHQRTTSELARDLDVTVPAASLQAKTLREAGLVASQRDGKAVLHQCTPLGLDLLTAGA
ncbi:MULTISPECIES: DUF5937 family protein [unclassified Nocardia]|uniref:ArsR/SmtB family transcription factor n=1 Tax=unclassified Nocardia TaxID=2637762 RepID=UPI001CE3BBAA|nr:MULTISPECIES: DUF5937 family protein [unclassified Nocardia]